MGGVQKAEYGESSTTATACASTRKVTLATLPFKSEADAWSRMLSPSMNPAPGVGESKMTVGGWLIRLTVKVTIAEAEKSSPSLAREVNVSMPWNPAVGV